MVVEFWNIISRSGSRRLTSAVVVAAATLLTACSAIKLAYDNAPDFIYWWLDGYVDIQGEQSALIKSELAKLHQWHRKEELPRLADLLRKVQGLAANDTTPAQVCAIFDDGRERYNAVVRQAQPAALALASSLQPAQLTHVEGKFKKVNAEWQGGDWAKQTPAERLQRRLKTNSERAEEFYGKLEEKQLAALRANLGTSNFDPAISFAERQRRQQDLLQTIRQAQGKAGSSEGLAALRAYEGRLNRSPTPGYQAYADKFTQESCNAFSALHNSTTPEQRQRAIRRLAAYERDARELAERK
jgi:Family of unknown function (DUF6279)